MPESIEHNASITGRIFEPYYKSLMVKIHITEKDQYTLIEQPITLITIRQLTVLLEYIDLFVTCILKSKDVLQPLIMCP